MKHKNGIKRQHCYDFLSNFPLGSDYKCVKINSDTKRCVSIIGAAFPNHEGFTPKILDMLAPKRNVSDVIAEEQKNSVEEEVSL